MRADSRNEILNAEARPYLAAKTRLVRDRVSGEPLLLYPEGVLCLNATAAAIVALCDGRRTGTEIVEELTTRYSACHDVLREDVNELVNRLCQCRLMGVDRGEGLIP